MTQTKYIITELENLICLQDIRLSSLEAELSSARRDCIKGRCGNCGKGHLTYMKKVVCDKDARIKEPEGYCDEFEPREGL